MKIKYFYRFIIFFLLFENSAYSKNGYYEISFSGDFPDSVCYFGITYNDLLGTAKPKKFKLNSTNKIELNGNQQIKYLFICSGIDKKEGSFIVAEGDKIFVKITSNEIVMGFSNDEQIKFYNSSEMKEIHFDDINRLNIKEIGLRNYIQKLETEKLNRENQIEIYLKENKLNTSNKLIIKEFSDFIFYHSFCLIFNECIPYEISDFTNDKVLESLVSNYLKIISKEDITKFLKYSNFSNLIHNFSRGLYISKSIHSNNKKNEERSLIFNTALMYTHNFLKDICITKILIENISDSLFCMSNLDTYYKNCKTDYLKEIVESKFLNRQYNRSINEIKKETIYSNTSQIVWSDLVLQQNKKEFVVYFWASWCGTCIKKIPEIIQKNIEYENQKIVFINIDDNENSWRSSPIYLQLNKINNNYHIKSNSLITKSLDIKYLPRAVKFNPNGTILSAFHYF